MPFNGAGLFTRIYQWVNDAALGLNVDATRTDTDSNDIASGLSNCITRDGQSPWLNNLPAGNFKITGLGTGSLDSDSVNYAQVFKNPVFTNASAFDIVSASDNSQKYATTAMVQQVAFQSSLPVLALGFLFSSGSTVSWSQTATGFAINESKGADIPSAATINLTTATGNLVHVTGNVQINAITIPSGAERTLVFDGTPVITHNPVSLILPTGANITAAIGDTMVVRGDGAGVARVVEYQRSSGDSTFGAGRILLAVQAVTAIANIDMLNIFSSKYDSYEIEIQGVEPASNDSLLMRLAVAGVLDTAANYYPTGASPLSSISFFPSVVSSTGLACSGYIRVANVNDTSNAKMVLPDLAKFDSGGGAVSSQPNFVYVGTSAVSGFRLYWLTASNFAATGIVRVYGFKKSIP